MKDRPTLDDGSPLINSKELALLLGVTEADIKAHAAQSGNDAKQLPVEWMQQGRRRQMQYSAATGRTDMVGALEYWATQQ